ncbi:MAG: serine--tRNA ligase [Bacteroidetes bacterium]|nr:MAG: serine--tRNA ligase [Bacteroidota bacterium]
MLVVNKIRAEKAQIIEGLKIKNFKNIEILDEIIDLDDKRKEFQKKLDDVLSESKSIAKEIGMLFKTGKIEEANNKKARTSELKELSKKFTEELNNTAKELTNKLLQVPNAPHSSVPAGNSDKDNEVIKEVGEMPNLASDALPHWELTEKYDIIDFKLGTKITGAGFPLYKGKGARLQRALINFFLDEAEAAGYREVQPPLLVNEESGYGTGQLPDKEGQMYHVGEDNLYLIPTAEVPITNIYRNEIVKAEDFPIRNTAYSQCFRREAGSYGKDVRGLNRLHQFDKVEIVVIEHPEKSYKRLEEMSEYVQSILVKLELPYRLLRLCGGDLSFTAALTYDMEVYSAAQKRWLEVSSVSNFVDYQANRLKLRYKDENGKTQLAHTLNGSALALPRIVAALLENNQTPDGIRIPKALVPYTGFDIIN